MVKLFVEPLFYIFFVYGASFLLMGCVIMKGSKGATSIPIIGAFHMLAFFGFTHGITEIIDWIRFILKTLDVDGFKALTYLSQTFLILSFVLLLQFTTNLLACQYDKKLVAIKAVPLVLLAVFIVIVLGSGITDVLKIGLLGRYSFGFAGAALGAVSLLILGSNVKLLENRKLYRAVNIAAIGFACYAVFGGLIIKPIAGIPIQVFRAACALMIAYSSFDIIDMYKYIRKTQEA